MRKTPEFIALSPQNSAANAALSFKYSNYY